MLGRVSEPNKSVAISVQIINPGTGSYAARVFRGLRGPQYRKWKWVSTELYEAASPDAGALFRKLSPVRMAPYLAAAGKDESEAMSLYLWNCAAGAALWEVLGHLEVAIRHALDSALTQRHIRLGRDGEEDWLWHAEVGRELGSRAQEDIDDALKHAEKSARRGKYTVTTDHVIAELNFGFWRFLFTKDRESSIGSTVRGAFPNAPKAVRANDVSDLHRLVSTTYDLRNRIAHHEPIWWTRLHYRHDGALRLLGYICEDVREFVSSQSRFPAIYDSRPDAACTGTRPPST